MAWYGLTTWYDGEKAEVDIVFVHGLRGGRESTWTKDGVVWPKELLSKDIPKSRILSFGYDSGIEHSDTAEVTQSSLADDARKLCSHLDDMRDQTGTADRPIIVIGYSLGGLVLAQVVYGGNGATEGHSIRSIAQHIKGMIFLGTPFFGSKIAGWGEIVQRIYSLVQKTDQNTLKNLKVDSEELKDLRFGFPDVIRKRNQTSDKWVVKEEDASYPGVGEILPMQANHLDICKFDDAEDDGYKQVRAKIKQAMEATDITETSTGNKTYIVNNDGTIMNLAQGDMRNKRGRTALQAAAERGDIDAVQLLLDAGADVNAPPARSWGRTALQAAAEGGYINVVQLLLEKGADANAPPASDSGRTALQAAAERGDIDAIQLLLYAGADINAPPASDRGRTALQAAAKQGDIDIVQLLLDAGADVNAPPADNEGRTALQAAAEGGHINVVQLLLENGADVNAPPAGNRGRTAFQAAAKQGDIDVVQLLLDAGADVNAPPADDEGRTALQAAAEGGHINVVQLFLEKGVDANAPPASNSGRTALQAAAERGDIDVVQLLLDAGADVNAPPADNKGRTALQAAAEGGYINVVQLLLKKGADVNAPPAGDRGRTALQAAAEGGHINVVQLLLENGADANAPPASDSGRTALQAAAERGHVDAIQLLLDAGADVNTPPADNKGRTALQAAAEGGHINVVQLLLKKGADANTPPASDSGRMALQAAAERGHVHAIQVLLYAGADINAPPASDRGRTALQAAAKQGDIDVVQLLLDAGADVNAPPADNEGRTALQAAAEGGYINVVQLLLENGADVNALPAGNRGRTALQAAAEGGYINIVQLLLENGVDVNTPPARSWGRTALQAAAEGGYINVVQILLKNRADVNAPPADNRGRTALQAAAEGGHINVVQLLLENGADINALPAGNRGRTALQAAAERGDIDAVQLLLDAGADVNAPPADNEGRTALQAAAEGGHINVVQLLLKKGADVNAPPAGDRGRTALQAAVEQGYVYIVRLLEKGASAALTEGTLFPITIHGTTLAQGTKAAVGSDAADASKSNYILIQSRKLLTPSQMEELSNMSLVLHKYVSKNTYLYRRQETDLDTIRQLKYVVYADVYRQEFKETSSLKAITQHDQPYSTTTHRVDVVFHDDVDAKSKSLRRAISEKAHIDTESLEFSRHKVRLTIHAQYLKNLASIDEVLAIEEVLKVELRNRTARRILRASVMPNQIGGTYEGNGEVVAVADTGFDRGNMRYTHPAFRTAQGEFQNRVLTLYPMSDITSVNDFNGHGTHVCGSVLGDGTTTDTATGEEIQIKGTAPKANLVVQCLGHDLNGIPRDLTDLFRLPYNNNQARVHTNSWGAKWSGEQSGYTQQSVEIDSFVWEHADLVICFAAGNDGNGRFNRPEIGAEAAAKNCITVGASENMEVNQDQVAAFSSCGPTIDRRIKPDVVAPGTNVLSANSGHRSHPNHGTEWSHMSGTSMATPLVAGCAAVLREALITSGTVRPSAALIKALLINGAVPLGRFSPNRSSGFGRVDLANSIDIACRGDGASFREGRLHAQLHEDTIPIKIPENLKAKATLKVTLVWSDFPASSDTGMILQNKLILIVDAADRRTRRCVWDNNVQQVRWAGIPPGHANVIIRAERIIKPGDSPYQPYACAWRLY